MNKSFKVMMTCMAAAFLLVCQGPYEARAASYITGSGCSISDVGYLGALARYYENKTGLKVFVRGGGSVVGIEDLKNGTVDFAASCRGRTPRDPRDIRFIQVAWDSLVFIVHQGNPVDNISLDEVRSIYAGRITSWRQLGGRNKPIKLFVSRSRMGLSGVETSIRHLVLRGKAVTSPEAEFVPSSGIVEQLVENTPDGFATTGFSSAEKRQVKMLKVNGVYPSVQAIIDGHYGLTRPLYLVIPAHPKPEVMKFVKFTLSKEGQQFINSQGVVSLLELKKSHLSGDDK